MARYSNIIDNDAAQPLAGALVTVKLAGTDTLATLTTDLGAPLSNPLPATGSDGAFSFNAANGYYQLYIVVNGHARDPLLIAVGDVASFIAAGQDGLSGIIDTLAQEAIDELLAAQPDGHDIILSIGQSNNVGQGLTLNSAIDVGGPRIFQFPDAGTGADTAIPANEPLHSRGDIEPVSRIGNAVAAARAYLPTIAPNRDILIVPMAVSGTSFSVGYWGAPSASGRYAEQQLKAYQAGGIATHTITFPLSAGGTVTVTLVASGASGNQINVGADAAGLLTNLKTWLDAHVSTLPFTTSTVNTITETLPDGSTLVYPELILTAKTIGSAGNALSLAQSNPFSFLIGDQGATANFLAGCDASGGSLYLEAVAQVNQAMAYGLTGNRVNRLAWLDWQQGESDINLRPARYAAELDALIAALRANVTGASASTPFIIGGMVPEYIDSTTLAAKIDRVHRATPSRDLNVVFVPANRGSNSVALGEAIFHHDAPTQRALGAAKAASLTLAQRNALIGAPGKFGLTAASAPPLGTATLSWTLPATGSSRFTSLALRYRKSGGTWATISVPVIATTWTVAGLDLASTYEFQVQGANEAGPGLWSDTATATTGSVPHLLDDQIVTANAAFSLRKLRAAYAGHCIKVRRASPSATMDIDFNANGMVDIATIQTFLAGSDGFIDTWYDQSGNAHNAVQATTASQPRIAVAGVVNTRAGLPYVDFYDNGSTCVFMAATAGFPVAADFTVLSTIYEPTGAGTMHVVGPGGSGNHSLLLDHRPTLFIDGQTVPAPVSLPAGGPYQIGATYQVSDGSIAIYQSGAQKATGTINPGSHAVADAAFQLGTYQSTDGFQLVGSLYEALILPTKLNATQMANLGAAAALHWGAL